MVDSSMAKHRTAKYKVEAVDNLWLEYLNEETSLCGLCGNRGIIDTRRWIFNAQGRPSGILKNCICPNGRARRAS